MIYLRSIPAVARLHVGAFAFATSCLWEWLHNLGHDRPWPT